MMGGYQDATRNNPWGSSGRETVASRVGESLLPVGTLPFTPLSYDPAKGLPALPPNSPDREKFLMNIVGTAIQAGKGKLATCAHVLNALDIAHGKAHMLARFALQHNTVMYVPYPIVAGFPYVDPRSDKGNPDVDLAILVVPAKSTEELPYTIPNITWGDSTQLGPGDPVIVGGYPHGTTMFLLTKANRGFIQPTFYSGIVSAILPATKATETRIIQISVPVAGGMSGGVLFNPETGEALGMITSGLVIHDIPQPVTYAIPSEVVAPFVDALTFETRE